MELTAEDRVCVCGGDVPSEGRGGGRTLSAMSSASPGRKRKPVSPSLHRLISPPAAAHTVGTPDAMLSSTTKPVEGQLLVKGAA